MKRSKSLPSESSSSTDSKRAKLEEPARTDGEPDAPNVLEFSDDVLLNIMKYLTPQDLMALSLWVTQISLCDYTRCCQRLSQVTQDKTLWKKVDFRSVPMSMEDLQKYVKFLQPITSLAVRGLIEFKRPVLTQEFLNTLCTVCSDLKELIIEEFYIAGERNSEVRITDFPRTIERLSLKNCEIDYSQSEKTYFSKLNSHMPNLTCLILTNFMWFSPHSLLAISKIPKLKELRLISCRRVGECVAYTSLATRFGFKTLEILDLRNTALGDSEVACFSSTKTLTHLYLECPACLRNNVLSEYLDQQTVEQQQRPFLGQEPVYEDGNLVQFLVGDNFPWESYSNYFVSLISDRAICALGSDTFNRRVVNNNQEVVEEDERVFNNPNLKTLVVRHYPQVTNLSLVHLALKVSSLEYLDVTGTSVTKEGIQTFKSQKSNVKVVSSFDEDFT